MQPTHWLSSADALDPPRPSPSTKAGLRYGPCVAWVDAMSWSSAATTGATIRQSLSADRWPDEVTFGDLQPRMLCAVCGHKGADVRPDWGDVDARTLR